MSVVPTAKIRSRVEYPSIFLEFWRDSVFVFYPMMSGHSWRPSLTSVGIWSLRRGHCANPALLGLAGSGLSGSEPPLSRFAMLMMAQPTLPRPHRQEAVCNRLHPGVPGAAPAGRLVGRFEPEPPVLWEPCRGGFRRLVGWACPRGDPSAGEASASPRGNEAPSCAHCHGPVVGRASDALRG